MQEQVAGDNQKSSASRDRRIAINEGEGWGGSASGGAVVRREEAVLALGLVSQGRE
jgi:hypothetical protein